MKDCSEKGTVIAVSLYNVFPFLSVSLVFTASLSVPLAVMPPFPFSLLHHSAPSLYLPCTVLPVAGVVAVFSRVSSPGSPPATGVSRAGGGRRSG